jgi:hypothetical protein
MLERLFHRLKHRRSSRDYYKSLQRYRREHPGSLEEERQQINHWLALVEARRLVTRNQADTLEVVDQLQQLREAAHTAFMSHPAATEIDFRRCWPSIRQELLTQHALNELAGNPALLTSVSQQVSDLYLNSERSEQVNLNIKLIK